MEQVRQNAVVDKFVAKVQKDFPQVTPSVDWESQRIQLAAKPPHGEQLRALAGAKVDTLTVELLDSKFRLADYNRVLKTLSSPAFRLSANVEGVNIPALMQTMPILYKGFASLGATEREAIQREMTRVTGYDITLIKPRESRPFTGTGK